MFGSRQIRWIFITICQGAVPIEGCIIIAMTNKYEEMKLKCLALFWAGRLTPIHFGNFNIHIVNKISRHYYDIQTLLR